MFWRMTILALAWGGLAKAEPSVHDVTILSRRLTSPEFYERDVRPINEPGQPTKINFSLTPICFELDQEGIMKGKAWYKYWWTDKRLVFNSDDWSGISSLRLNQDKIWLPDVTLYNRNDLWNPMFEDPQRSSKVVSNSKGQVWWVPARYVEVRCNSSSLESMKWTPQTCQLRFGSWTYHSGKIDLQFMEDDTMTDYWESNCPFELVSVNKTRGEMKYGPQTYPYLNFDLTIRRRFFGTPDGLVKNSNLD